MTPDRLALLLKLANQREAEALQALADAQAETARREAVRLELFSYLQGSEAAAPRVESSALLLNQQAFCQRLRQALSAQTQQVELAGRAVQSARDRWLLARQQQRTQARLQQQAAEVERKQMERRAQIDCDELAAQRWLAASLP